LKDEIALINSIIDILVLNKVPVVFKGASVLKSVIRDNSLDTDRITQDLDMDWINPISNDDLNLKVTNILNKLSVPNMSLERYRDNDPLLKRSAGYRLFSDSKELISFDISIRNNPYTSTYTTLSGTKFVGASREKMYADKLSVLSSKLVFRRTKDIYDLYVLSLLGDYTLPNIIEVLKYNERTLCEFEEFLRRKEDLEHAYNKLEGISNKPDFETVYSRILDFCLPFIIKTAYTCSGIWLPNDGLWHNNPTISTNPYE